MNKRTSLLLIALGAVGPTLAGCGVDKLQGAPTGGSNDDGVGNVALALQLAPGVSVNTFTYSLTGPSTRMGSINVANSTTVSTLVSAVPVGTGYSVALNGTATDGTVCAGTSTAFNVAATMTTPVSISISCNRPHTTGTILIKGTINVCAAITSVSANPPTGATIAISSAADDPDAGPGVVQYHWTTSAGTLSDASAQNPTLTCSAPGTVSLTLTVTDGDPACGDTFNLLLDCPPDSALSESAWVEIGANNQAIARLITPYTGCPSITIDGATTPMNLRAGPATIPVRTTSTDPTLAGAMTSGNSKASVFSVTSCELNIPAGAHAATVAGKSLPLPKADVQRVVVLGDTGCRISIGNPYQACGDPAQWPFSVISSIAANMHPDLVLHVGDYQYRDNPCPADQPQCQGTPWGYGYDTWNADLFQPAAPLLAAAPWIMVRGNHETCNRAGQGWYRFLDPNPYSATKNCDSPANDDMGNYNDPWAVTFGDTQVIAFDSANAAKAAYSPMTKPADVVPFNNYTAELAASGVFSANPSFLSIFAVHHPILGYTPGSPLTGGNPAMLSVMNANYPSAYYPPGVGVAMHGHVHDFQGISFASGHPATFVAGHGGDNLDAAIPATISIPPAAGTVVDKIAYSASFGFMVMDKVGPQNWTYTAYRTDGTVLTQCTQVQTPCSGCSDPTPGKQITCSNVGSLM